MLLEVGDRGQFLSAVASGHAARGTRGGDVVCAAVSVLLRTAVLGLERLGPQIEAADRGFLSFRLGGCPDSALALLCFTAEFLERGLRTLMQEYPSSVHLCVRRGVVCA